MITKPKEKSLSVLISECDDVFRKFIQLRDEGKACFICGAPLTKDNREVAHYIRRQHLMTRWSANNASLCCFNCNRNDKDHEKKYRAKLVEVYGELRVSILDSLAKSLLKPMRCDIIEKIDFYKVQLKQLRK